MKEDISSHKLSPLEKYKICYCVLLQVYIISLIINFYFDMTMLCQKFSANKKLLNVRATKMFKLDQL